jgi:hypothetical protein
MKKYIALGGTLLAAALATLAIDAWPASETDKARDDGERVGVAVNQLYEADDVFEADAARTEIDAAVAGTRLHAGDAVADQVDEHVDAWSLGADVDYILDEAADFRSQCPQVNRAFWDGFESGVNS